MQVLFERERRPEADPNKALVLNEEELGEMDRPFAEELLKGVLEKHDAICKAIMEHAPDWTLDRMDPISRCVLCVGAYEILFSKDAPPAVIMNEAIEIAKEFGSDESGKFVNGVLNAMVKK
jgi:N utilization substance protein B